MGAWAPSVEAQVPGEYPHLVLTNSVGDQAPPSSGPFDNSGVSSVSAGSAVEISLTYQALAQPNPSVLWGLLISVQETGFPTNVTPPPLFTQPPFNFFFGPMIDASGASSLLLSVPAGLVGVEAFVQAVTYDSTSFPNLQLSNGVRVQTTSPRFNVAFSFARYAAGLNDSGLQGVSSRDIDGDTLNTLVPLGPNGPPSTDADPPGFEPGFIFLPVLPNVPDAPVNPLARPFTRLAEGLTSFIGLNEILVEDVSYFPPRGEVLVQQADENPFATPSSANVNLPNLERMTYTGVEIDSETGHHKLKGVRRVRVGTTGSLSYPHDAGDLVWGRYTFASSPAARTRTRVALDASNAETPHVVIPAFTADLGEGVVTRDQDLYLFEEVDAGLQGFAVLDRVTHSWHIIEDSIVDTATDRVWDPMVCIAPDGRSMIACQRVAGGTLTWDSNPDGLFAIRLDGLDWPASGSEVWEVSYELHPDPVSPANHAESREIYMRSVGIIGPDPDNFVAYVGLKTKWQKTSLGQSYDPILGHEGFLMREELLVKEYVEVPLIPPGSFKGLPSMPRPFISEDFDPTGTGLPIVRFDPSPLINPDKTKMFVSAGSAEAVEDFLVIRNIQIGAVGVVTRVIQNISGLGFTGGTGDTATRIHRFELGGHGTGTRAALSPDGTRIAWLRQENVNADYIMIARTNGADYSSVDSVYKAASGINFREPGEYLQNHIVSSMYFVDEDNLVFLMGDGPHNDALGLVSNNFPRFDLFRYTISTDTMVNLSRTSENPNDFETLGKIRPAGSFKSDDGRFLYILRDGPVSQGNTTLPVDTEVFNLIGLNLETYQVFDVTGDELGGGVGLPNLDIPDEECLTPVETAAVTQYVEGWGSQSGMHYFTSHLNGDATLTDELFVVDADAPFVALEVTSGSPEGAHITNVAPSPYSSVVLFARTSDSARYASTQHPFAVDLDNFLFERDLTPAFQVGGQPFGRLMDGSIHFIPATSGAGDAVIFAAGSNVVAESFGVAQNTSSVYYSLASVSDPVTEPLPTLIPVLSTNSLGVNYRIYILSAGASASP
jgi:hypothetical protein